MAPVFHKSYVNPGQFSKILGPAFAKSFKSVHFNAQSIRNKEMHLTLFLEQLDTSLDVIMVTETWSKNNCDLVRLPTYQTFFLNRDNGRGGGVCMLFRNIWEADLLPLFTVCTVDYEVLSVCSGSTLFVVCYRPPQGSVTAFISFFESLLSHSREKRLDLACGGDININMLSNDISKRNFDLLLQANGFSNVIDLPTRITQNSSTLLDLFITNIDRARVKSGVISADISDHLPIYLCFIKESRKHISNTRTFQPITENALSIFRQNVAEVNWDFIVEENNPEIAYDKLIHVLKPIYKASFPFKVLKNNHRTRKPWITQELLTKIRSKNTLYHKFIKTKDVNDLRIFKNIRNRLNKELKKARADYYANQFVACQGRTDLTWKKLNYLLGKQSCEKELSALVLNGQAISGQELSNEFIRHFVSIFSEAKLFNDLRNIT